VKNADIIIIGAGAAGLMCAITAARRGRRVLVLERSNKVGKNRNENRNGVKAVWGAKPTLSFDSAHDHARCCWTQLGGFPHIQWLPVAGWKSHH